MHPVFFGAAITGAGVAPLMSAIAELLPSSSRDDEGALDASVFKIERGADGEKIAYVRVFSGTLSVRDRVRFGGEGEGKVTALAVFEAGPAVPRRSVSAGAIAKVWGLHDVRMGDRIGVPGAEATAREFPPPTLESVVEPTDPDDAARLRAALAQLDEHDPLINVRQDDDNELSVSLYGEVQKEVIQATLADDYGIDAVFREVTPIYIERPLATAEAVEILHADTNPYMATIALRVAPADDGSGIEFRLEVDTQTVPLYVYKTRESFAEHMEQYVLEALAEGLFGWQVTDCVVTMTQCAYAIPDGPPSRRGRSTATDFRKLTPLVLRQTLELAGTAVCEPMVRATLEIPADTIGGVMPALSRLGATVETSSLHGDLSIVETIVPAARVNDLQRRLPGLTHGEGVLESTFAGYQPVARRAAGAETEPESEVKIPRRCGRPRRSAVYPDARGVSLEARGPRAFTFAHPSRARGCLRADPGRRRRDAVRLGRDERPVDRLLRRAERPAAEPALPHQDRRHGPAADHDRGSERDRAVVRAEGDEDRLRASRPRHLRHEPRREQPAAA